ncbi:uncharacterized protein N7482_008949 [Penicillium canariense]|uniref:Uncharacterized protein n=1 Tax=Penicillium canariense TaxID=189055 RepID=A0A9W9HZE2_9EURO|nr:uncharacterized protein N7482_008949 [Penicillium canariense]KAJ5157849.1 hypothetical protein N7482_008949 [Penicillium canariense]
MRGSAIAHPNTHGTQESHSRDSERAVPEDIDVATPVAEDEAGEDVDAGCEVIEGVEDELVAVFDRVPPPVLDEVLPAEALVVCAPPVVAVSVVADTPVVMIGPPGFSDVIFGSGLPVNIVVSKTHTPPMHVYPT